MNSNDYNREKIMNLIAAVDNNWAIGKNNQLLVRIPMDQKFFREMTTGKVVVMGRKTLESFPNSRPLKNRTNIVLTHNPSYEVEGAVVVHSLDELHKELEKYNSEKPEWQITGDSEEQTYFDLEFYFLRYEKVK